MAPAVKRAIWQTIQITEELSKIQKGAPEKIFVEMARGEEKEKRKKSNLSSGRILLQDFQRGGQKQRATPERRRPLHKSGSR